MLYYCSQIDEGTKQEKKGKREKESEGHGPRSREHEREGSLETATEWNEKFRTIDQSSYITTKEETLETRIVIWSGTFAFGVGLGGGG